MKITDINIAIQKCHKNKILVYPVKDTTSFDWLIERCVSGKKYKYPKKIDKSQQSKAMSLTYIDIANKL